MRQLPRVMSTSGLLPVVSETAASGKQAVFNERNKHPAAVMCECLHSNLIYMKQDGYLSRLLKS